MSRLDGLDAFLHVSVKLEEMVAILLHLAVGGIVVSALLASKVYEWSGHGLGGVVVVSLERIWSTYVYVWVYAACQAASPQRSGLESLMSCFQPLLPAALGTHFYQEQVIENTGT